jgi:sugar/nucleoside kinase (ribokinase family)
LRIAIASHIVIDTIKTADGRVTESIGGPSSYCGITSTRFGFGVSLATKVGKDFPKGLHKMLESNNIRLNYRHLVDDPTTRFEIISEGDSRRLLLNVKCKPMTLEDVEEINADCWLASPVFDELPEAVLAAIKEKAARKNFVMLDPQGYLRKIDQNGCVKFENRLKLDLSGINAIKVDTREMKALTGGLKGLDGMQSLRSQGIEFVISTEHQIFHLLHKQTHYWINMPNIEAHDSTGMGDILCASFSCAYMKEKDPIWAICFGAGAVRAALETGQVGIAKIPSISNIEQNASYFYNSIGFEHLS